MFAVNPYVFEVQQLIGANTGINLSFNVLKSMMKEHDIPLTDVSTNGDPVGLVYDQTVNALILKSPVTGGRPVLGSDGTRTSYLTFDGTDDRLQILNSISFFNTFWQAVPKGTFLIWFKMNGGDGVSQYLFSNTTLVTTAGIQMFRSNSNTILVRGGDGTIRWTYTSTATVTSASGWRGLIVSVNGVGASAGRFILMNSAGTILENATFSVTAGSTVNANTYAYIGTRSDNSLFLNGSISSFIVENFPVTDQIIDQFKNHNPARTSSEFTPMVQYLMDMNNSAFIFSDAAGTTPATNGVAVRTMRSSTVGNFNTTPAFGALRRIWLSAASGSSATYRTNQINGNATIEFDGGDNYDLTGSGEREFIEERAGKWTLLIVAKNDDVTVGSHIISGSNYITLTGSGYSSGAGLTYPYVVMHTPTVGQDIAIACENPGVDDYKVIVIRRNGSALSAWNGDKVKVTDSANDIFYATDFGNNLSSVSTDWKLDGHVALIKKYNGVLTDEEVEQEIDALNARFGL